MMPDNALQELSEPDQDAILTGTPRQDITAELLGLCDEFFRQASPVVHAELRKFLTERGHHPITGHSTFVDNLGFATLDQPDPA